MRPSELEHLSTPPPDRSGDHEATTRGASKPPSSRRSRPTKVIDVHIDRPLSTITGLDGYEAVHAIVRLHGAPLGSIRVPVTGDRCLATMLAKAIVKSAGASVLGHLLDDWLASGLPSTCVDEEELLARSHPEVSHELPSVTVAVCTRNRPEQLSTCLASLERVEYPRLEVIVVDNAPEGSETESMVRERFAQFRYVREPRQGLDWARNRAIAESSSDVIAFADDDVVVDPHWVAALGRAFAEETSLGAVTGLVAPLEQRTEAQVLFERYGGFGKGFERRWYRAGPASTHHIWGGAFGTGANMAFRRGVFEDIGRFDPALDVGTVTNGGGDNEMFFRVLQEGYCLRYEPSALVWHRHREDYASLREQLTNNGIGLYASLMRCALAYPSKRVAIARFCLSWLRRWCVKRLLLSFLRPSRFPRDLIVAELKGSFVGLTRYPRAWRRAQEIARAHGTKLSPVRGPNRRSRRHSGGTAVRNVDLESGVRDLTDVRAYARVRVYVHHGGRPLGFVEISNLGDPISGSELRAAIVQQLPTKLLESNFMVDGEAVWGVALQTLMRRLLPCGVVQETRSRQYLDRHESAAIVVATLDRPDALRACLDALRSQETSRSLEIVVVDNNPASGLTPPVVSEFPGIRLVDEQRRGLARARNAGIRASSADIIVLTEEDVRPPPEWLERLLAPFSRNDVAAVTGTVLPLELEERAQLIFQTYGGLGRGFEVKEVNDRWFESSKSAVPTWQLGTMANAAFRAWVFDNPEIGLIRETLSRGMAEAAGEDMYLFYKIIKAGHTLVYEPSAWVRHRHHSGMDSLRHRMYASSKGHVAYHLTTLFEDHDMRALSYLAWRLPRTRFRRLARSFPRLGSYPVRMAVLEAGGDLVGPAAFLRSRRRMTRKAKSRFLPLDSSTS